MAIALGVELKPTQALVLTPQLRQAIQLLQLPAVELEALLRREACENPFLRVDDPPDRVPSPAGGWAERGASIPADMRLVVRRLQPDPAREPPPQEARLRQPIGLRDSLRQQIGAAVRDPALRTLALALVELVDEDGYLREPDEELARLLGATAESVQAARAMLQACEPTGVGARDLAECLALQLAERGRLDSPMRCLLGHLELVARGELGRLERMLGIARPELESRIAELRRLDPRPGASLGESEPVALVPDLLVERGPHGRWRVAINEKALPKVMVDREWWAELASSKLEREVRRYVSERVQAANWLVRALEQRSRTLLRVAVEAFRRQRRFLDEGPRGLRPLTLRDIARRLELHESTVSRAVAGKYVATPHGTFAFKYFFTSELAAVGGGESHSAEAVRLRIRELIAGEHPARPLSDEHIARRLQEEGIAIARRTVAKYREALGIPASSQRRRIKALRTAMRSA